MNPSLSYKQPQGMHYRASQISRIPWVIQFLDQTTSQYLKQPTLKNQAFLCLSHTTLEWYLSNVICSFHDMAPSLSYNQPQGMYYWACRSSYIPWIIQFLDQTTSQDVEQPTLKDRAFVYESYYTGIIFRITMTLCPSCYAPYLSLTIKPRGMY